MKMKDYKGKPLTNRNGELEMIGVIADNILGIRGLREMGFIIPETSTCLRHAGKESRTTFYV